MISFTEPSSPTSITPSASLSLQILTFESSSPEIFLLLSASKRDRAPKLEPPISEASMLPSLLISSSKYSEKILSYIVRVSAIRLLPSLTS